MKFPLTILCLKKKRGGLIKNIEKRYKILTMLSLERLSGHKYYSMDIVGEKTLSIFKDAVL